MEALRPTTADHGSPKAWLGFSLNQDGGRLEDDHQPLKPRSILADPAPHHFCPCIVCNPPVSAQRFQFSNSPASKSCEPETAHLGAPQRDPESKLDMRSATVIRLSAHEVAYGSRCRILAQTAINMDRSSEQISAKSERMARLDATWNAGNI